MPLNLTFHLIYVPGDPSRGVPERMLSLVHTDDALEALRFAEAVPDALALQLDAHDEAEAMSELHDLGFAF